LDYEKEFFSENNINNVFEQIVRDIQQFKKGEEISNLVTKLPKTYKKGGTITKKIALML